MNPRLIFPVVSVLLQTGAALLAIGPPDAHQATDFFSSYPTVQSSLAAAELLVWVLVILGGLWTVLLAIREFSHARGPVQRRFWEGSVLVIGAIILLAGAGRQFTYTAPMFGGTVAQAQQAAQEHVK
jgi:hypothetical protein